MTDYTSVPALPAAGTPPVSNPDTRPPPPRMDLGKREKAAVIVRLLLNEGTDIPLEDLPEDLQSVLTEQMGSMGLVDRDTLWAVASEFADELEGLGLTFPKGIAGALTALDGRISPQTAARLRKEAGVRQAGDPWTRLQSEPVEDLAHIAEQESIEVAAVLLSKLPTEKAAQLLGHLPGPTARRITYAVSQTGKVTPDAVDRIGLALAAELQGKPDLAFDADPVDRVGEILNYSTSSTRDDVLTGLDQTDAAFANRVRKAIFTFSHLPQRVDARDVGKITRAVDVKLLVTALSHARKDADDAAAAEFVLSNVASRLADSLREQIDDAGYPSQSDGEDAMTALVVAVRELAEAGEITLRKPEDSDALT